MGSPTKPQLPRSRTISVPKSKSCTMSPKSRSMSINKPFGRPSDLSNKKFILNQFGVLRDLRKGSLSRIRYHGETRLKKLAVALSCGAYNIPGIIVHYKWKARPKKLKMSLQGWFYIQSMLSFLSDVHFAGRTSLVHYFDRIWASGTMSGMTLCWLYIIKKRSLKWAVIAMLHGILSLHFLRKSRKSKNYKDFAIWHCIWHYFGAYSMALVMAMAAWMNKADTKCIRNKLIELYIIKNNWCREFHIFIVLLCIPFIPTIQNKFVYYCLPNVDHGNNSKWSQS